MINTPNDGETTMLSLQIRVQNGALLCGRNGGNVRVGEGQRIRWVSDDRPFTLEFFRVAEEEDADEPVELTGWPFAEPSCAAEVRWPVRSFEAVLKSGYGIHKYYITVGNLRLDPIIIVDRLRNP